MAGAGPVGSTSTCACAAASKRDVHATLPACNGQRGAARSAPTTVRQPVPTPGAPAHSDTTARSNLADRSRDAPAAASLACSFILLICHDPPSQTNRSHACAKDYEKRRLDKYVTHEFPSVQAKRAMPGARSKIPGQCWRRASYGKAHSSFSLGIAKRREMAET